MNDQLKERLKKIQALAERGVGGEAETAKKKLQKMLAENGMTEADLNEDKQQYYLFSYSGAPYRLKLLGQIIYKVLGATSGYKLYKSKHTRNKFGVYCTPAQKLEIDLDYEFYCNLFEQEMQLFLEAFISKQEIFPEDVPHQNLNIDEMSPEQKKELFKKQMYENSLDKRQRAAGMLEEK